MKKLYLLMALVISASFIISCGGDNKAANTKINEKITNVEIYTVKPSLFVDYINLPIIVLPNKEANLGVVSGGKVVKIYVDKGDRVKTGQLLLETETDILKPTFESAKANFEFQKSEFERSKKLFDNGSISQTAYDAASLAFSQARSAYDITKKQLDDATLEAPFSGIITLRNVEVGDILSPGAPAFRIIDVDRVKVQAGIPEKYIADFKKGSVVSMKFDAFPMKEFKGKINFISPEAAPAVRTFMTEIEVENKGGIIKAGIMGSAQIEKNIYNNALLVPLDALIETQEGRKVFTTDDDKTVNEKVITFGGTDSKMVMVLSGLKAGDKVIAKGQYDLVNGEKIKITGEYKQLSPEVSE